MATSPPIRRRTGVALVAGVLLLLLAGPASAQILPWEIVVAEVETGRLRHLAERLARQNLLYQLRLGGVRKSDLVETVAEVDRVLEMLEEGSPARSIPAPWTPELRDGVRRLEGVWRPLRRIAVADPYDTLRISRQFLDKEATRGDPLLIWYFDERSGDLVEESEKLLALYHAECAATGLEICATARNAGLSAMLMERAVKEAVYVVAGTDVEKHRARLEATVEAYRRQSRANDENPFFAEALDPERGRSARAAAELLASLRGDWSEMSRQFRILEAGDESNFDLSRLLAAQSRISGKIERLTAALLRYASLTYGS